jgi:hypothetical protein
MPDSEYINWEQARSSLQQAAEQIMLCLRICDIVELIKDPSGWSDEDLKVEEFVQVIPPEDSKMIELCDLYKTTAARAKVFANQLNNLEVDNGCVQKPE